MRQWIDLENHLEKLLECNSRSFLIEPSLQPFRFIAIALVKFHQFMFQKTIEKHEKWSDAKLGRTTNSFVHVSIVFPGTSSPKHYWNVRKMIRCLAGANNTSLFPFVSIVFLMISSSKDYWNVWKKLTECILTHFTFVSIRFPERLLQNSIETNGLLTWQRQLSREWPCLKGFRSTRTILQNEHLFRTVLR